MNFTCKKSNANTIYVSGQQILDKLNLSDVSVLDEGKGRNVEIALNSSATNIIRSEFEHGSVVMRIDPFSDISILHYTQFENGDMEENPLRIRDMKSKEAKALFNFANGYLMCLDKFGAENM
ncbi:MAG: hypothetical protein LUG99_22725 [Lachnospiraceae bacterium]|nr:hypothetical protein [Lachnospiraceae bacterium]